MTSALEPAVAEQEIARIIRDELLLGSGREIPFDQPLGELGVGLDSLALVNLLTAVEAAYGVEISDDIWTERGPLSVDDLADLVRSAPRTAARPTIDRDSPVLQGRMERFEHAFRGRGAGGRAVWAAIRVAAPVKRFLFHRTRHLLLERRLDDVASMELAPPSGIDVRPLAPEEKPDLSDLWAPANAKQLRHVFEQAVDDGAIALVACEGSRVVALDLISGRGGEDVVIVSPGACYGFLLLEAPAARGRGIGLALAAYSFVLARELGFRAQLTHVWEGNSAMLAAATQLLGFRIIGSGLRMRVAGMTRWSWQVGDTRRRGRRLVL
jgi:acyl carrier protein/GNAT superfamily N-acetyltransferase